MAEAEPFQLQVVSAVDPVLQKARLATEKRIAKFEGATKIVQVLNLGAGVQSSAVLLMDAMAHRWGRRAELETWLGEPYRFDPLDFAVFADTQDEPGSVAAHLAKLQAMDTAPILTGTAGRLGDDLVSGIHSTGQRFAAIPSFTRDVDGVPSGITKRQCTAEYKVHVCEQIIRREIIGLAHREHFPTDTRIVQSFGLSYDEPSRIIKVEARVKATGWATPKFPLNELQLERSDCAAFLATLKIDAPRSACVFCPYKSNSEWRKMRDQDPESWARAVYVDDKMRSTNSVCTKGLKGTLYVHRSRLPLAIAPIDEPDSAFFNFGLECEGMCGN